MCCFSFLFHLFSRVRYYPDHSFVCVSFLFFSTLLYLISVFLLRVALVQVDMDQWPGVIGGYSAAKWARRSSQFLHHLALGLIISSSLCFTTTPLQRVDSQRCNRLHCRLVTQDKADNLLSSTVHSRTFSSFTAFLSFPSHKHTPTKHRHL